MIDIRHVTERVLLGALREQDAADIAESRRLDAQFLADAGLELGASLEKELTYRAIANLVFPRADAWCVVDVIEGNGALRRVAVIHPDPLKHAAARTFADYWTPAVDDVIGVPALGGTLASVSLNDPHTIIAAASAHDADAGRVAEWFGAGPVLVVPLQSDGSLLGAITFVARRRAPFSPEEIAHSEALAARCAQALERARVHAHERDLSVTARAGRVDAESARDVAEGENSAKDRAIALVSHELRTPLGAIANNVQILQLEICGPVTPMQRAVLDRIAASHEHVMSLVDQLLDLQRLATGHMHFEIAPVSVLSAVRDAADMVAWQFTRSGVELSIDLRDEMGELHTDRRKFTQIVMNLMSNAAKFTPAGGRVSVSGARMRDALRLQVLDTGIGIAREHHESVFEPFVQLRDGGHSHHGGAGLGLSISRQFARGLSGDLTLDSALGEGSTFTLTIPDSDVVGPADAAAAPRGEP